jgi:cytochrome c
MRKTAILASTLCMIGTISTVAMAADGSALYVSRGCVACHGANGAAPILPIYPSLAGQKADYMLQQMKDIKSGARSNGQTASMKPIIAYVSEDEMKTIADWLSQQACK